MEGTNMRLNDPATLNHLRELEEARIRAIVREEIVNALGALKREAEHQDMPYETGELESSALSTIGKVAEGTVARLTCEHPSYPKWHGVSRCGRCGEPEPAPVNPFEDHEHVHDDSEGTPTPCIECGAPYPGSKGAKTNG
jgi:hypothetical protein